MDTPRSGKAPKKVVGLKYEKGNGLPRVILKGGGLIAEDIVNKCAVVNSPVVVKDENLLKELFKLPVDAEIGRELFELVALLLAHVYAMEEKLKGVSDE